MQHLRHRAAHHIGALFRYARGIQIAPGVFGIAEVYIGGHIHNPAVRLLRQTLIKAAVARLHMEDGDVQPLGGNDGEAGVGVAQNQHSVRLFLDH